jgi:hypothetical protein
MQTIPLEQVEGHLAEIVEKMTPGEEVVLTPNNRPWPGWSGKRGTSLTPCRVAARGC